MARIAGVRPDETRAKLVDAAARVFELKGYEGATVAEIAREAGATTGAIYTHFDRKADLLVEALRVHSDRLVDSVLADSSPTDAPGLLRALAGRLPNRDAGDTALLCEALLGARRDAELAQVLAIALGDRESAMAALLAEGQARGELAADVSAAAAARFTLLLALGSMFVPALDLAPVPADDWDALVRRALDAFTPTDNTPTKEPS